jgi:predicted AlkP superfamily phosphohydrolase/phosphomutase/Flp pilus assembly protein TadD
MSKRIAKKVLLIGWDAADWKVINPLMDQDLMPTLESIVNKGVIGNLATLDPPLSPILWTSISTGKLADKHGILGFVEPDPDHQAIRPSLITSRKVKAIWNILSQSGLKCNVVGWWPSHPAEPINGVMVSNFYQKTKGFYGEPWPMAPDTVHPAELADQLAELRLHSAEITAAHILPFVPALKEEFQEKYHSLFSTLAKVLAHAASIHNAATFLERNTEWDFMAVYHDAIDHFSHGFMKFHPPQRKGIPDQLFETFKDVVSSAYRYHDMMLQRMLDLAGEDTTVLIISDHGFHSDHLRPNVLPKEPAGPAYEHAPFGIFALNGPGILQDERVYGATLLDIAPTLLTLFGLPVAKDMDGKPLVQVFKEKITPDYIESWEQVEGASGQHPGDRQLDPWAAQEAMNQLVELGYIEAPGDDKKKSLEKTRRESEYYLARVYIYRKQYDKAAEVLERLFAEDDQLRYGLSLATCYQSLRKAPEFRKVLEKVKTLKGSNMVQLEMLEGALLLLEYKPRRALEVLKSAEEKAGHMPSLFVQIGKIYLRTHRYDDAERAFKKALDIDPQLAAAHHGLGVSLLRRSRFEESAEEMLNAIGLQYYFPIAHYHLGESLMNLGHAEQAAEAFEVCCALMPGNRRAHLWLIKLYEEQLSRPEKADEHRRFVSERIKGTITIVSGLPRSGTSMMMQMLEAGGAEILTDRQRQPDDNNPRGYYEYEKTKKMITDVSWLEEANGKVVKIVAPLLNNLPNKYDYKVIFMRRDMAEILRSQQIMLGQKAAAGKQAYPIVLADAFNKQLEKAESLLERMPHAEVLYVDYAHVVENAAEVAETVAEFLGENLDTIKMAAAVDKNLYRNKSAVSHA